MQKQGKLGENLLANHLSGRGVVFRIERSHNSINKKTIQWNIHKWFRQMLHQMMYVYTYIYIYGKWVHERRSTLLLLEKCRFKPQWDAILYLLECIKLKRLVIPSVGEDMEQTAVSCMYTTGGNGKMQEWPRENRCGVVIWPILEELSVEPLRDSAVPLLDIYLR